MKTIKSILIVLEVRGKSSKKKKNLSQSQKWKPILSINWYLEATKTLNAFNVTINSTQKVEEEEELINRISRNHVKDLIECEWDYLDEKDEYPNLETFGIRSLHFAGDDGR